MSDKVTNQFSISGADEDLHKSGRRIFLFALALATFIRLWGLDFGLPYEGITYDQVTYEESQEVHRAFKLAAGEYSMMFGKGGLYLLLFFEYGIFYVFSYVMGWVDNPQQFAVKVVQDRTAVYMLGRITVVVLGLLTYAVIFRIGQLLWDWRAALAASVIGMTAYYHTLFSTVINVDIGMTLALWASLLLYLAYERTEQTRYLLISGAIGGIAVAFKLPGVFILPLIFMALLSGFEGWRDPVLLFKRLGTFCAVFFIALTIIAPEWTIKIGSYFDRYVFSLFTSDAATTIESTDIDSVIRSLTVVRAGDALGYLRQLVNHYNIGLTLVALAGFLMGIVRRQRWAIILGLFVTLFVSFLSITARHPSEHYLLPVMPALWLLAAVFISAVYKWHRPAALVLLSAVIAVPGAEILRHNIEKMHPDTRVAAKDWIEKTVKPDSKILIDGMQFRYIPSPPLTPNEETVARQFKSAERKRSELGRGWSKSALDIYKQAINEIDGPRYNLHSTIYGLELTSIDDYIERCFQYVITSSYVTDRFAVGAPRRDLYPRAAEFYESLSTDHRVQLVFEAIPERWRSSGPSIRVYELDSNCRLTS
jgi:hypothetical protein